MSSNNESRTKQNERARKAPLREVIVSWAGLIFGLSGAILGSLGYLNSLSERDVARRLEVQIQLDRARDILGGQPGTESISSRESAELDAATFELARRHLKKLLLLDPSNARVHNIEGTICLAEKNTESAAKEFKKALELDDNPDYRSDYAGALAMHGEFDRAVNEAKRAIREDEDEGNNPNSDTYQILGEALRLSGHADEALSALEKSLLIDPTSIECINSLALVHEELNHWDEAESYYHQAIRMNPSLASGYYNLGVYFTNRGKFERARKAYLKALEIQPFDYDSEYAIGYSYYEQGMYTKAFEAFQRLSEFRPDSRTFRALGLTAQMMGDEGKASRYFERAAALEKQN